MKRATSSIAGVITPWWLLQADAQYFFRPPGGIPEPDNPTTRIGNEFVLGVRTNIFLS